MRVIFATLYQRFEQRIYMMLNDATLYRRFEQRIYMMLNYGMIQLTGYLKQLALRVYIVYFPPLIPKTLDKYTQKCIPRREKFASR